MQRVKGKLRITPCVPSRFPLPALRVVNQNGIQSSCRRTNHDCKECVIIEGCGTSPDCSLRPVDLVNHSLYRLAHGQRQRHDLLLYDLAQTIESVRLAQEHLVSANVERHVQSHRTNIRQLTLAH